MRKANAELLSELRQKYSRTPVTAARHSDADTSSRPPGGPLLARSPMRNADVDAHKPAVGGAAPKAGRSGPMTPNTRRNKLKQLRRPAWDSGVETEGGGAFGSASEPFTSEPPSAAPDAASGSGSGPGPAASGAAGHQPQAASRFRPGDAGLASDDPSAWRPPTRAQPGAGRMLPWEAPPSDQPQAEADVFTVPEYPGPASHGFSGVSASQESDVGNASNESLPASSSLVELPGSRGAAPGAGDAPKRLQHGPPADAASQRAPSAVSVPVAAPSAGSLPQARAERNARLERIKKLVHNANQHMAEQQQGRDGSRGAALQQGERWAMASGSLTAAVVEQSAAPGSRGGGYPSAGPNSGMDADARPRSAAASIVSADSRPPSRPPQAIHQSIQGPPASIAAATNGAAGGMLPPPSSGQGCRPSNASDASARPSTNKSSSSHNRSMSDSLPMQFLSVSVPEDTILEVPDLPNKPKSAESPKRSVPLPPAMALYMASNPQSFNTLAAMALSPTNSFRRGSSTGDQASAASASPEPQQQPESVWRQPAAGPASSSPYTAAMTALYDNRPAHSPPRKHSPAPARGRSPQPQNRNFPTAAAVADGSISYSGPGSRAATPVRAASPLEGARHPRGSPPPDLPAAPSGSGRSQSPTPMRRPNDESAAATLGAGAQQQQRTPERARWARLAPLVPPAGSLPPSQDDSGGCRIAAYLPVCLIGCGFMNGLVPALYLPIHGPPSAIHIS